MGRYADLVHAPGNDKGYLHDTYGGIGRVGISPGPLIGINQPVSLVGLENHPGLGG